MEQRKKNYCKWGAGFAIGWLALTLGIYTLICLVEGVPFSENMEADSCTVFYICYAITILVWFYIGYALRRSIGRKKRPLLPPQRMHLKLRNAFGCALSVAIPE